jgi:alpha-beta hydrolase superfamily lysophospholipase
VKTILLWAIRLLVAALVAVALIVFGGAFSAVRRLPDLQPWHELQTTIEPTAAEITPGFTFDKYLRREDAVFREVHERVEVPVSAGADASLLNRYVATSRSHPLRLGTDWNRTQVLDTSQPPSGGALLVHGLTDSPYSMRTIAAHLHQRGFYTVSLRMQGHGTVPGGLVRPTWEDWSAAVAMGVRQVRQRIGPSAPLVLVGYSNGGALVTKYTLDAIEDTSRPMPDRVVLLSPMIGVSPLAGLARVISALGPIVPKARWLDVFPEYNPYKYLSFPANAGAQTGRLTNALFAQLTRLNAAGQLGRMPRVLAFQSAVDTTVSTPAVVYDLFDRLGDGRGHQLVLFDLNRQARVDAFIKPGALLPRIESAARRGYDVTLITNTDAGTLEVSALTRAAGSDDMASRPLNLSWPEAMFSLSHIALPFPEDDPIYGARGDATERGGLSLGRLTPRGEKDVLVVPLEALMRVSWNPFFRVVLEEIDRAVAPRQ